MRKILLMLAMMLPCLGVWAQTPVVQVSNIGTTPFQLSDEDAAKIFELDNLTVVLDVTTAASLSGRGAFFCVADPAQPVPSFFSGTNTSYMACGHVDASIAYIAAAKGGQHFSTGTIPANSTIRIAYVFDKTNNNFKSYIGDTNTAWTMDRNFGNYEIATPKMVKEDFENAKIYIGGGMANNANHELGDATIHSVRVFDGTLDINAIKALDKIVVNTAEDFKNGKIYTFVTERGWMGAKDGSNNVISTAKTSHGLTGSKEDANFQWTVYKSGNGNYYLYNIGKDMFMGVQASNNASVPFAVSPTGKKLTFKVSSNLKYPIMFSTNNAAVVNHSTSYGDGCISWTGGWGTLNDGGSNHKVELVGNASEEVMAKIEKLVAVREIGYFRLKGNSGTYIDASATWGSNGQMSMKAEADCNPAGAIFYYDDNNGFLNYANGRYINGTRGLANINSMGNTWSVYISPTDNKYTLFSNDARWLHDNSGNRADRCDGHGDHEETNHSWTLEKVTSLPVTITDAKYATFYAPVAVEVPEGVTAHTVTLNGEWATLNAIESGVIPANTGVVLYAKDITEATTYNFTITEDVEAIEGNDLRGSAATTYFTTAGTYYALGLVEGEVGFYKDSFSSNRFQNNSHKAYLYVPNTSAASAFKFRFEGGITAIESVINNDANAPIYDLSGRRVMNAVKGGIYIQNGKKFIVK